MWDDLHRFGGLIRFDLILQCFYLTHSELSEFQINLEKDTFQLILLWLQSARGLNTEKL